MCLILPTYCFMKCYAIFAFTPFLTSASKLHDLRHVPVDRNVFPVFLGLIMVLEREAVKFQLSRTTGTREDTERV